MTLGNKIAQLRKEKNITQDALAQQLGITNQAVSKWESDQCCPDVLLLPKLADIFGVSMDALFGRAAPSAEKTDPVFDESVPWPDDDVLRVAVYVGRKLTNMKKPRNGLKFVYEGDVSGVLSDISVQCGDVHGDVDCGNSVYCGNVEGDVDSGNSVYCGNVGGNVDAGNTVSCGNVEGDVDAGSTVNCGNVEGDVDAGSDVSCGDVGGDVNAGCNVDCSAISGDVDAGGKVTIRVKPEQK